MFAVVCFLSAGCSKSTNSPPVHADEFELLDLRRWDNALQATRNGTSYIPWLRILHNNMLINFHVIEAACIHGVKKLFFTSSACVYPEYLQKETNVVPLKEEDKSPRGVHYEEGVLIFALCSFHFSIAKRHRGGFVFMRVIPRLISFSISAVSLLCPLLLFSCTQPTDFTDKGIVEREHIEVSGSITEDTVWEQVTKIKVER